jgi:hypothetical protein
MQAAAPLRWLLWQQQCCWHGKYVVAIAHDSFLQDFLKHPTHASDVFLCQTETIAA